MVSFFREHPEAVLLVEKTDRLYRNLKDWITLDELRVEIHFVKEGSVISPELIDRLSNCPTETVS